MTEFALGFVAGIGACVAAVAVGLVGFWLWAFQDWRRVGAP